MYRERNISAGELLYQMENNGELARKFKKYDKIYFWIQNAIIATFLILLNLLDFFHWLAEWNKFCNISNYTLPPIQRGVEIP